MNIHILTNYNIPQAVINCPAQDAILLMQEAVYLALQELPAALRNRNMHLLSEDWGARGGCNFVSQNNLKLINNLEFTELCTQASKCITW